MMHHNRRSFIKKSAAGALGLTILPTLGMRAGANDRIRIAHIGVGGMGNNHINWFAELPEVEIVALCDTDENHLNESLAKLKVKKPDLKVEGYGDFRHILDRNDIDAITCATPDHWHSQVAMLAFQSGKDVYGEKPLSYSVNEGQMMLEWMNKYNRIFQLGTQIHAGDNYHRVAEIIQSGAIGKVHTVRLWKDQYSPELEATKNPVIPASLNWDMWLGPAPYADYEPNRCFFNYRYFLDYSGGIFADFWCHIADIVWWSINPTGLVSVEAVGEIPKGIGDAPKWVDAEFDFENLKLYWTTKPPKVPGAKKRNIGAYFEGNKGTLICDYNTRSITINGVTMDDIPSIPHTIPRSPGHQQNFVDSVKSRSQPESNLPYARKMTMPMHLALISWRLGRKLQWDEETELFIGDNEANILLSRKARDKWNLIG